MERWTQWTFHPPCWASLLILWPNSWPPLGINQGDADITRLDAFLHTAKVLGVIEEYAVIKEPHCLGLPPDD